jgi:hypothetical protein
MRRFLGNICALMTILSFFAVPFSSVASSDPRLLTLVPPDAQIVAGIDSPPPKGQAGSFVLVTPDNMADLEDFFALTGVDSSRIVQHAVFVSIDDNTGHLGEHSLLVSGHFNQARIFKSAADGGANIIHYRGIPVAEIQPFARERGAFNDVRWLAILDSDVLVFGTIPTVLLELDRHLTGSVADPSLLRKLARMHRDDETWCLLSARARNDQIRNTLAALDSNLAKLAGSGDAFQFGIRYRRQVEFEYEVTTASAMATRTISDSLMQSLAGSQKGSSFLSSGNTTDGEKAVRGVVKIPPGRFGTWLAKASMHGSGGSSVSP